MLFNKHKQAAFLQKGAGEFMPLFIIAALMLGGAAVSMTIARQVAPAPTPTPVAAPVVPPTNTPTPDPLAFRDNSQKQGIFDLTNPTATPTPPAETPLCKEGGANNEPEILVGYFPAAGQTVSAGGQIIVWVNDEGAPIIAPNEIVDPTTGQILTPGDRTAQAGDGYLWEPALYIAPQTAETGGTPHFPVIIKGDYNNTPNKGKGKNVPGMDTPPPGSKLSEKYTAEFIWDVNSLGLTAGNTYLAQFVIHDGDDDRGVGCINIVVQ